MKDGSILKYNYFDNGHGHIEKLGAARRLSENPCIMKDSELPKFE